MNILERMSEYGRSELARSSHDFGTGDDLLEIPSGGFFTRFCYVRECVLADRYILV